MRLSTRDCCASMRCSKAIRKFAIFLCSSVFSGRKCFEMCIRDSIYYMLSYAFHVLHEQGYKDVATEDFENTAGLLSAILCRGVSIQIKRGLCRQYITNEEPLASPRGKIVISESIKTQAIRKKQLVCAYDEFSVDAYTNRIIKTTMELLLQASISKTSKKELRKLLIFFDSVSVLDTHCLLYTSLCP